MSSREIRVSVVPATPDLSTGAGGSGARESVACTLRLAICLEGVMERERSSWKTSVKGQGEEALRWHSMGPESRLLRTRGPVGQRRR